MKIMEKEGMPGILQVQILPPIQAQIKILYPHLIGQET